MPVTWVAWAMVPSTLARIRYRRCHASPACPARAAVRASWIRRCRKPSWRPERTAVVHRARAGHGWQVALANRAMMMLVPLLRAGVQELLTAPDRLGERLQRRGAAQRAVRPVLIVVNLVLAQDPPQMSLAPDEGSVQQPATASPNPAFGDRVHTGRPDIAEHGPDASVGEDSVERAGEVRSAV